MTIMSVKMIIIMMMKMFYIKFYSPFTKSTKDCMENSMC